MSGLSSSHIPCARDLMLSDDHLTTRSPSSSSSRSHLRSSPSDLPPPVPLRSCHALDFTHRFPQKGERMALWISIILTNASLLRRKVSCPQATIIPEASFQMVALSLIVKIMQADSKKRLCPPNSTSEQQKPEGFSLIFPRKRQNIASLLGSSYVI